MQILRKHFPEIITDNDEVYFQRLHGFIESIDELCSVQITYNKDSYHFRIAPSVPKYLDLLLREILNFHNIYGLRIEMSKSIKTSTTINFSIKL